MQQQLLTSLYSLSEISKYKIMDKTVETFTMLSYFIHGTLRKRDHVKINMFVTIWVDMFAATTRI